MISTSVGPSTKACGFLPASFQGTRVGDGNTPFGKATLANTAPAADLDLQRLQLDLLAPGHGELIADPAAKITEYLEHREARERALLVALDDGERSRERLLDAAWADVPAAMRPAAAMAMQAHLEKLEAEGRLDPSELVD